MWVVLLRVKANSVLYMKYGKLIYSRCAGEKWFTLRFS